MKNIKLTIAYDGGSFLGWQKTKEGPSIEETLQGILEQVLQESINLQAASRTDAGVHAHGQVINFISQKTVLDLARLCRSLNCLLPSSIAALAAEEMPLNFHPTLDCCEKEYHYWICNSPAQLPHHRFYSWHYHIPLNLENMLHAAQHLEGVHDFHSFANSSKNSNYSDYIRKISSLQIYEHPERRLQFIVKGPNFLYRMIRNVVGTLVYVGVGKLQVQVIPHLLTNGMRVEAGITAPAHGLTLYKVLYN